MVKEPSELIAELSNNRFIHIFLPYDNDKHYLIELIDDEDETNRDLVIYKEIKEDEPI